MCGNTWYYITVTDNDGCSDVDSVMLNIPNALEIEITHQDVSCHSDNDGSASVSISGGTSPYSILWSNGVTTADNPNLYPGTYSVTVTDNNGCSLTDDVTLVKIPSPRIIDVITQDVKCHGGSDGEAQVVYDTTGLEPFTFQWSSSQSNSDTAVGLSSGNHSVTIIDANNCADTATFIINEPSAVQIQGNGPDDPVCIGQQVDISAQASGGTPPYSYIWPGTNFDSTSSQTVTATSNGAYTVYAVDANGCTSPQATIYINVYPPLDISVSGETDICEGEAASLVAVGSGGNGGPYSYIWDNGSNGDNINVYPHSSKYFHVTVYDNCGTPPASDSIFVNVHEYPKLISLENSDGCEPLTVVFNPVIWNPDSGLTILYNWDFGDYSSSSTTNSSHESTPTHIYDYAGSYNVTLTLTSGYGCSHDTILENFINVYPTPVASFSAYPTAIGLFRANIIFTDYSEGDIASWFWNFGDSTTSTTQNPLHTYTQPGKFNVSLIVENFHGCSDTTWNEIEIYPETTFYPPTAFTPGSGFVNNYFYPKGVGISKKGYHMYIYDRWGELIYESDVKPEGTNKSYEVKGGWNGRYNNTGEYVPAGVYVWIIEYLDAVGERKRESGQVTVIR